MTMQLRYREFFEVAGSAGLELDNYRVVMYNGSNGGTYGADDGEACKCF